MEEVRFERVNGFNVPLQPWPQVFYVSRAMLQMDAVEVRPLTFTGLVKGIGKNFITMSYWRIQRLLWAGGFLAPPAGCYVMWKRDWRWDFRKTLRERRERLH